MTQYMFDTNIFNRILNDGIDISQSKKGSYYVTHIQVDEINNTKNEAKRQALLVVFQGISNERVRTESAVYGISRYGESTYSSEKVVQTTESFVLGASKLNLAKLGNGEFYSLLLIELNTAKPKDEVNNRKDALIGETSIKNQFTLVTDDRALHTSVAKFGGSVLSWDEFLDTDR